MKKLLLIVVLTTVVFASKAQENVVKINIFSPIVRTASLFYERALTDNTSGQIGFFYTGFKVGDTKFSGFGITPEWRYYLSDEEVLRGFYIGPFLRYQSFTMSAPSAGFVYDQNGNVIGTQESEAEATLSTFGGGAIIGRQWLFKDRISLDIFVGPSFNSGSLKVKDDANEDIFETGAFDGFSVRGGVTLGIAF